MQHIVAISHCLEKALGSFYLAIEGNGEAESSGCLTPVVTSSQFSNPHTVPCGTTHPLIGIIQYL